MPPLFHVLVTLIRAGDSWFNHVRALFDNLCALFGILARLLRVMRTLFNVLCFLLQAVKTLFQPMGVLILVGARRLRAFAI